MMGQFLRIGIAAIFSIWACVYIGSLVPKLWRQQNYRGAVGVLLLAFITLLLPLILTLYRNVIWDL